MNRWWTLEYWANTPPGVAHFFLAIACLVLGAYVLYTRKGTTRHRLLGSIWLVMMITVNTTALTMYDLHGRPNLFHLFAVVSLATIIPGYIAIRRYALTGERKHLIAHEIWMRWGYFGLASAGAWQLATRVLVAHIDNLQFGLTLAVLGVLTGVAGYLHDVWIRRHLAAA